MNIAALLSAMAGMGMDSGAMAVLREFAQEHGAVRELTADERRFLDGPVVVHESPWRDTLPGWMPAQAKAERAEILLGGAPGIVGPTEIAAVMYPRTFESPMPHDMAELYLWASTKAAARHFDRTLDDLWKSLGGQRIEDRDVLEPAGRLYYTYRDLAHEIRRKVAKAQKAREPRHTSRAVPLPQRPNELSPDSAGFIQLSFYAQLAA